jgi:hypothetical protein
MNRTFRKIKYSRKMFPNIDFSKLAMLKNQRRFVKVLKNTKSHETGPVLYILVLGYLLHPVYALVTIPGSPDAHHLLRDVVELDGAVLRVTRVKVNHFLNHEIIATFWRTFHYDGQFSPA